MAYKISKQEQGKLQLLQSHYNALKDLTKWESKYTKLLTLKVTRRPETIARRGLQKANLKLRIERNSLKSRIWIARSRVHRATESKYIKNIKCHIDCEEHLSDDIRRHKNDIQNLSRQIKRVTRQIYMLDKQTVPSTRAQEFSRKWRNQLHILENQLEGGVHRECSLTAVNGALRQEIMEELNRRKTFTENYEKLIGVLNSDRKYLVDAIEYAMLQFELCVEIYEKVAAHHAKTAKDMEMHKIEMQDIVRKLASQKLISECALVKGQHRVLAGLSQSVLKRRDKFRTTHQKKINVCNQVLDKIYDYTKSKTVAGVIKNFTEQESLYYSFFNYANETSYHMTLLNNAVNSLYTKIDDLKQDNRDNIQKQVDQIDRLERQLKVKEKSVDELQAVFRKNNENIEKFLSGFKIIRDHMRTDWSPLSARIGDYTHIDLGHLRDQLKLVETRTMSVVSAVYLNERRGSFMPQQEMVVKAVEKLCEWPTDLEEIVLTQQCPECAEGDAFNMDDAENVVVQELPVTRRKICERVVQPEMQYRLHSLSTCRFPRARMLMARRNMEIAGRG